MEVEIRAQVDSLEETKRKLEELGATFEEPVEQKDFIFKRKGTENEVQKPGSFILRLRKSGDKNKFTFKALTEITGAWDEHDVVIDNFEEMKNILLKTGFTEQLRMNKIRIKAKLDDFKLCLDDVKELDGGYIEAELISNNKEEAKKRLIELFNKIGITEDQIEHKGYVAILFEKKGIKFNGTG